MLELTWAEVTRQNRYLICVAGACTCSNCRYSLHCFPEAYTPLPFSLLNNVLGTQQLVKLVKVELFSWLLTAFPNVVNGTFLAPPPKKKQCLIPTHLPCPKSTRNISCSSPPLLPSWPHPPTILLSLGWDLSPFFHPGLPEDFRTSREFCSANWSPGLSVISLFHTE